MMLNSRSMARNRKWFGTGQNVGRRARIRSVVKNRTLVGLRALGVFRLFRLLASNKYATILAYHGIWLGEDGYKGDALFMRPATFVGRLDLLARLGYRVVSLSSVVRALRNGQQLKPRSVVITIDDGWYSTFKIMVPALREREFPATLYCDTANIQSGYPVPHVMADYLLVLSGSKPTPTTKQLCSRAADTQRPAEVRMAAVNELAAHLGIDIKSYYANRAFDYMTADELRQAQRDGLDVQLHTHTHTLHDMSPAAIAAELQANFRALDSVLGAGQLSIGHFCYPSGRCSPEAAEALEQLGILSSTTTRPGPASRKSSLQMLPRLLDGENVEAIEVEAELCGFMPLVRSVSAWATAKVRRGAPDAWCEPPWLTPDGSPEIKARSGAPGTTTVRS